MALRRFAPWADAHRISAADAAGGVWCTLLKAATVETPGGRLSCAFDMARTLTQQTRPAHLTERRGCVCDMAAHASHRCRHTPRCYT